MYTASAQTKKAPAKKAPAGKSSAADIAAGQDLISKSDCLTCHKLDVKIIGPAYKDVAAKYKPTDANVALLAKKVLEGGSGVWGAVPMSAHPNLSTADAKKMVRYILSVK
ncbi:c-type cytochrome [Mucilaginibacter myungsuensis]|uniref:C-type cytochrome n=2 Tax=Mucilaginibacter myungsuensis TaxID=649104 RepID=A0A929KXU7_9SPHI|nr:c-type cytochrome [Mucilaginibacter myungsuensis]